MYLLDFVSLVCTIGLAAGIRDGELPEEFLRCLGKEGGGGRSESRWASKGRGVRSGESEEKQSDATLVGLAKDGS